MKWPCFQIQQGSATDDGSAPLHTYFRGLAFAEDLDYIFFIVHRQGTSWFKLDVACRVIFREVANTSKGIEFCISGN